MIHSTETIELSLSLNIVAFIFVVIYYTNKCKAFLKMLKIPSVAKIIKYNNRNSSLTKK